MPKKVYRIHGYQVFTCLRDHGIDPNLWMCEMATRWLSQGTEKFTMYGLRFQPIDNDHFRVYDRRTS